MSIGAHLQVFRDGDMIVVQDDRNPAGALRYTFREWLAFTYGAKAGDFDHLLPGGVSGSDSGSFPDALGSGRS
ncbi:MAG: hypothetical protein ABS81_10545 [Pseudonocardia sp. SCN 72-86]|nr:MAG: hypothetical protein ABS81_10545 [Pseudonocardia sp. SCN 72-86]